MRKILGVSLLVLLLTSSADAGLMPNGSPRQMSPSQPPIVVPEPTDDDDQDTASGGDNSSAATATLTQTTLDMLALLSSLL